MGRFALYLTSVSLCLLVVGCGGPKKQILGKWKTHDASWEFFDNGVMQRDDVKGHYSFGDNYRIKIQTPTATFLYQYVIQGETMTWTGVDGSKLDFTRVR